PSRRPASLPTGRAASAPGAAHAPAVRAAWCPSRWAAVGPKDPSQGKAGRSCGEVTSPRAPGLGCRATARKPQAGSLGLQAPFLLDRLVRLLHLLEFLGRGLLHVVAELRHLVGVVFHGHASVGLLHLLI